MRAPCPCGQKKTYMQCCRRLLTTKDVAKTAEALMRSRYTAFVKHDAKYLARTVSGPAAKIEQSPITFNRGIEWDHLEIHQVIHGQENDARGEVEFTAFYRIESQPNQVLRQYEHSLFEKHDGQWFYVGARPENVSSRE